MSMNSDKSFPVESAPGAVLYIFFGLIATGKSTLARAWASRHDLSYYNSDVVRKELAGLDATSKSPDEHGRGIYTPEFTARTYEQLRQRAETDLRQGRGVVLDASYTERAEREQIVDLARSLGVEFHFVQCWCSDEVKRQRLARRSRDPGAVSDGRWEIYLRQRDKFQPPVELPAPRLTVIDTAGPLPQLLDELELRMDKAAAAGADGNTNRLY